MAVLAIIAVLAALLFPVFQKARVSAYGAASTANLRSQYMLVQSYSHDWDLDAPLLVPATDRHVARFEKGFANPTTQDYALGLPTVRDLAEKASAVDALFNRRDCRFDPDRGLYDCADNNFRHLGSSYEYTPVPIDLLSLSVTPEDPGLFPLVYEFDYGPVHSDWMNAVFWDGHIRRSAWKDLAAYFESYPNARPSAINL